MKLYVAGVTPKSSQNNSTCELAWFRLSATHVREGALAGAWGIFLQFGAFGFGVNAHLEGEHAARLVDELQAQLANRNSINGR